MAPNHSLRSANMARKQAQDRPPGRDPDTNPDLNIDDASSGRVVNSLLSDY